MNKLSNDDLDEMIAVLMTELKAWREEPADENAPQGWKKRMAACMAATNATLAKHNKRM